jgi:hypothetical protein
VNRRGKKPEAGPPADQNGCSVTVTEPSPWAPDYLGEGTSGAGLCLSDEGEFMPCYKAAPRPPQPASQVKPPAPKPNTAARILEILDCAEKKADHYSIAGILGATKGTFLGNVAHAFGGNSISGILDISQHLASGFSAAAAGDSHGSAVATFNVYTDLALGGTAQGVITGGMSNPAAQGFVGTVTDALLGTSAEAIGTAKLGIDFAIFFGAAAYCVAHSGN